MRPFGQGVTISPADGGYIISWVEKRAEEEATFDHGPNDLRRFRSPHVPREAVRTTIEETMKLVASVLNKNRLVGADDEPDYVAGA